MSTSTTPKQPVVFISYSRDSQEHIGWVRDLATKLRAAGVDAHLDEFRIGPGGDLAQFMEQSISNADRVLLICTEKFVERMDSRKGGVGYEARIASGELMNNPGNKYIPVIRQQPKNPKVPSVMRSTYRINLSHGPNYERELERLIRDLHGTPLYPEPPLGANPYANTSASTVAGANNAIPIVSDTMRDTIEAFRKARFKKITEGQTPAPLADPALLVFHLLPVASFANTLELNVQRLPEEADKMMIPLNTRGDGWTPIYHLDGFAKSTTTREKTSASYSLLLRNGVIEGVDAYSFGNYGPNQPRYIRARVYEEELRQAMIRYGNLYQVLEISGPYFVSIALLGVKGLTMFPHPQFDWSGLRVLNGDVVLDLRLIQSWEGDPDAVLKPLFDMIWNACGLSWSRNYDANGKWRPFNG